MAERLTYFDIWPDTAPLDPSEPYLCVGGSDVFGQGGVEATIVADYVLLIEHLRSVYPGQLVLAASDWPDQSVFRDVRGTWIYHCSA